MQEENNRKISICVEKHTLEHKRKRIRKLDILVKNRRKLKSIKKGYLSQTANLFVNLKSNTMKNTLQRYGLSAYLQIFGVKATHLITWFNKSNSLVNI